MSGFPLHGAALTSSGFVCRQRAGDTDWPSGMEFDMVLFPGVGCSPSEIRHAVTLESGFSASGPRQSSQGGNLRLGWGVVFSL